MDAATTYASGTIRVVAANDKPSRVSVSINGDEAEHIGSSDNSQPAAADCVFMAEPLLRLIPKLVTTSLTPGVQHRT